MERGYPTVMAGKFNAYHHDPDSGVLTAEWDAEKGDSMILYLPHLGAEGCCRSDRGYTDRDLSDSGAEGCYVMICS